MPDENTPTPPALPPLPVLTPDEWRRLSVRERQRLRELKIAHRRAAGQAAAPPEKICPGRRSDAETPFRDIHGRSLHLVDLYYGASCFFLLSGPSSLENDLSQLRRRGIYVLSANNSAAVFRPNGWIFVDPPEKFHSAIWLDPGVTKFVHHRFLHYRLREKLPGDRFEPLKLGNGQTAHVRDMPGVVSIMRNADFCPSRWLSEPSINWGNSKRSARRNHHPRDLNVMLCGLKLAYALGFRAVYLLGCDFKMSEERPYVFAEDKAVSAVQSNNSKYRTIATMLALLKPHFDAAGFHVFNCNLSSGLTVFPFVSFSEAIEAASGHVPQDPLDTVHWYRK